MLIFVSGGVRSGKSAIGERIVSAYPGKRKVYLATSEIYDDEMARRINRHKSGRSGKGFVTVERSRDVASAVAELLPGDAVMLDCLGTLAANEMFGGAFVENSAGTVDYLFHKVFDGVMSVNRGVSMLVIISNEVFSDGMEYTGMTMDYINLLGRLHRELAKASDVAVECTFGTYIVHKGNLSILHSDS